MDDPFLSTWSERSTAVSQRARGQTRFEILAQSIAELDGELVYRVVVRSITSRSYDRVELAIAVRDYAILEYRSFLEPKDTEPILIARSARDAMVELNGHLLPTRTRYEDRAPGTRIDVELSHTPLPPEIPAAAFEPRSFHSVRLDGPAEEESD